MKLATFNVENLFSRARAMNLATWAEGKPILDDFMKLNELLDEAVYTTAVQGALWTIIDRHPGLREKGVSEYIRLMEIRDKLIKRPRNKPEEIVATGRDDWVGYFELMRDPIIVHAVDNVARVMHTVNADVLAVVEAEDRTTLRRFNDTVLTPHTGNSYEHIMLIDGNDDRGIDVGIMMKNGHHITSMRSHSDDVDAVGEVFSRDCARYDIDCPSGARLVLLINHFKSKGFGSANTSNEKRRRQAVRVRAIYDEIIANGVDWVAVIGDLNDTPDSLPLADLLADGVLIDVMAHPAFVGDGRPGTHGNGTKGAKLDYILMSPKLAATVNK